MVSVIFLHGFLEVNSIYPESEVRNPEDKQERTGVHITDR